MRNSPRTRLVWTEKDEKPKIMNARYHRSTVPNHAHILSGPGSGRCLDPIQLNRFEQALREWADCSSRPDLMLSRKRVLLIFLLIRYTGARLNEVLGLDPMKDSTPKRTRSCFARAPARAIGPAVACRSRKECRSKFKVPWDPFPLGKQEDTCSSWIRPMCAENSTSGPRPSGCRARWAPPRSFAGPGRWN